MRFVLGRDLLPPEFEYPKMFYRTLKHNLGEFDPWYLLEGSGLDSRTQRLRRLYPHLQLVPFAGRRDTDDVSCFLDNDGSVVILEDYGPIDPKETGYRLAAFTDWLRMALDDFIDFGDED